MSQFLQLEINQALQHPWLLQRLQQNKACCVLVGDCVFVENKNAIILAQSRPWGGGWQDFQGQEVQPIPVVTSRSSSPPTSATLTPSLRPGGPSLLLSSTCLLLSGHSCHWEGRVSAPPTSTYVRCGVTRCQSWAPLHGLMSAGPQVANSGLRGGI